jgi:hypothetical protein
MSDLSPDQFPYTVVSYPYRPGQDKPRAKTSKHAYSEDAAAAAQAIADEGTALPNPDFPSKHPRHGEYNAGAYSNGNRFAAVYLKGQSRYRNG